MLIPSHAAQAGPATDHVSWRIGKFLVGSGGGQCWAPLEILVLNQLPVWMLHSYEALKIAVFPISEMLVGVPVRTALGLPALSPGRPAPVHVSDPSAVRGSQMPPLPSARPARPSWHC